MAIDSVSIYETIQWEAGAAIARWLGYLATLDDDDNDDGGSYLFVVVVNIGCL